MTAGDHGSTGPGRGAPGEPFGYLGVRVGDGEVRTFGRTAGNRYLGRLAGARGKHGTAPIRIPRRRADDQGRRPEAGWRGVDWVRRRYPVRAKVLARALLDAPKIESELARFNDLAQSPPQ